METSLIETALGAVAVRHTRVASRTATILLHGAAGSWTTWLPAIEAAGGAEATDDLVVPDLPGWETLPPTRACWSRSFIALERYSALVLPSTGHFGHVERPGVLAGVLRSR